MVRSQIFFKRVKHVKDIYKLVFSWYFDEKIKIAKNGTKWKLAGLYTRDERTVENAKNEEASWKVSWYTEYFCLILAHIFYRGEGLSNCEEQAKMSWQPEQNHQEERPWVEFKLMISNILPKKYMIYFSTQIPFNSHSFRLLAKINSNNLLGKSHALGVTYLGHRYLNTAQKRKINIE